MVDLYFAETKQEPYQLNLLYKPEIIIVVENRTVKAAIWIDESVLQDIDVLDEGF